MTNVWAFSRKSITATLSALTINNDDNEDSKEIKGDESSIGSAGSLAKRQAKINNLSSPWNVDALSGKLFILIFY